jgi:hypothetical protein
MNTVVGDWYIVSVYDGKHLVGKVLYGTVIDDSSCRFLEGEYVCTSKIVKSNLDLKLVETHSGSLYQIIEDGQYFDIQLNEFELLRQGYPPTQIEKIRLAPRAQFH